MGKINFFSIRFHFFFAALLILVLYWAFFSLYVSFRKFDDAVSNSREYSSPGVVYLNFNDAKQAWSDGHIENSRGDTLVIVPLQATVFVKNDGHSAFRDANYTTAFLWLKITRLFILGSVFVLALILLIRFFTGLRRSTIFRKSNIRMIRFLALFVLIFWFTDAWVQYVNVQSIRHLFDGTSMWAYHIYPIDKFLLLIVAGMIFFVAEIMSVGNRIDEENKMTI